jgi:proteasome activator subunit 4
MYMNLDSITEPHKLTSAMMCVVAVSRPMLEQTEEYKEGRNHVLPLLMSILPGIDPNDSFKCIITFQFISIFATLVPLVDSSRAFENFKDLNEVKIIGFIFSVKSLKIKFGAFSIICNF